MALCWAGGELRTAAPLALAQSCRKATRPSRVLTRDSLVSPTGSTESESIMRWGEAIPTCLCSWLFRLSFFRSMKTRQAGRQQFPSLSYGHWHRLNSLRCQTLRKSCGKMAGTLLVNSIIFSYSTLCGQSTQIRINFP